MISNARLLFRSLACPMAPVCPSRGAGAARWLAVMVFCLTARGAFAWEYGDPHQLTAECEQNQAKSCHLLGKQYWNGADSVPQDRGTALEYFELACKGGITDVCFRVGMLLYDGYDVEQDRPRAAVMWEAGCKKGDENCCHYFGLMLKEGKGIRPDPVRAESILSANCEAGVTWSCEQSALGLYVDNFYVVLGAGSNGSVPVLQMLAYGPSDPYDLVSWYVEFEGYRAAMIFPTGMSLRFLGFRVRSDSPARSLGFYWANGPYMGFAPDAGSSSGSGGDTDGKESMGQLGLDSSAKIFLRFWALPALVGTLRANAGTSNFLEARVALENGVWGEFLARKLGFSVEYQRRFGSLWSNQQIDEHSIIGSIKLSAEFLGK